MTIDPQSSFMLGSKSGVDWFGVRIGSPVRAGRYAIAYPSMKARGSSRRSFAL
jgi:hypothetical protein